MNLLMDFIYEDKELHLWRFFDSYRDSKNMLVAMLTSMMPLVVSAGDFDRVTSIFEEIQNNF